MYSFRLPIPTSINATYRSGNGKYFKSQEARDWEEEALYQIIEQYIKPKKISGPIYVSINMFVKRDRDIDSGLKIVLDLLQGRFYTNDSQITHLNVKKYQDKKDPRVEIEIAPTMEN